MTESAFAAINPATIVAVNLNVSGTVDSFTDGGASVGLAMATILGTPGPPKCYQRTTISAGSVILKLENIFDENFVDPAEVDSLVSKTLNTFVYGDVSVLSAGLGLQVTEMRS